MFQEQHMYQFKCYINPWFINIVKDKFYLFVHSNWLLNRIFLWDIEHEEKSEVKEFIYIYWFILYHSLLIRQTNMAHHIVLGMKLSSIRKFEDYIANFIVLT